MRATKRNFLLTIMLLTIALSTANAKAKNVIIMIADGWDYNQTAALHYYTGKKPVYTHFKVKLPVSTYSASTYRNAFPGSKPGYDPEFAWVSDGNGGLKPNQKYVKHAATDSAAAATALATGSKTTDGYINMSVDKKPLTTIGRLAKMAGKSAGSISSVQWSHATPAVFGDAHNASRGGYVEIAQEMINNDIDVIMGAGSPAFDDSGKAADRSADMVGGKEIWNKLINNQIPNVHLVQTIADFKHLAAAKNVNGKYIGTVQASSTLQQARSGGDPQSVQISTFNKNVPTLALMSKAAINVLSKNPKGFFLMIEGGAVDWANHANQNGRVIEEMMGFNDAVEAVTDWIKKNGGWSENLLIVTGDHDSGLLLGPDGETNILDMGKGKMPGMKYSYTGHANTLLPLFAQGEGSELFSQLLSTQTDPVRGRWIDNTTVFQVMKQQIAD